MHARFGTAPNEEGSKERKIYAQSVCVCVPMPGETLCAHNFCMGMFGSIALTCHVLAYDQRQQEFELGQLCHEFFKSKFFFLPLKVPKEECDRSQML